MEQLETIKGKSIVIPKMIKRYTILYYDYAGWRVHNVSLHTNPEGALEEFYRWQKTIKDEQYRAKYYKIFEVELEVPFIPES